MHATPRRPFFAVPALVLLTTGGFIVFVKDQPTDVPGFFMGSSLAYDPSDDVAVAVHAPYAFVGRVVGAVGTRRARNGPGVHAAQFTVQVIEVVSGAVPKRVVIDQYVTDDYGLASERALRPGQTVLLLTTYLADEGWYHVMPGGLHLIGNANEQRRLVERFAAAARVAATSPRPVPAGPRIVLPPPAPTPTRTP